MTVHCDPNVIHAPGECRFCDKYGKKQQKDRVKNKINFTGHHDPDKTMCPSECNRPLDTINRWPGNIPQPMGKTMVSYFFGEEPGTEWEEV